MAKLVDLTSMSDLELETKVTEFEILKLERVHFTKGAVARFRALKAEWSTREVPKDGCLPPEQEAGKE